MTLAHRMGAALRTTWLLAGLVLAATPSLARDTGAKPHPDGAAIASAHSLATDAGQEILGVAQKSAEQLGEMTRSNLKAANDAAVAPAKKAR